MRPQMVERLSSGFDWTKQMSDKGFLRGVQNLAVPINHIYEEVFVNEIKNGPTQHNLI
jgi:hypothetical protein